MTLKADAGEEGTDCELYNNDEVGEEEEKEEKEEEEEEEEEDNQLIRIGR